MNAEAQRIEAERPHSLEAEQAVLGLAMAYPQTIPALSAILAPDHFDEALHGRIWECILDRYRENEPTWPEFIGRDMKRDPAWGQELDAQYIARLAYDVRGCPPPSQPEKVAELILDSAMRRKLAEELELAADDVALDMSVDAMAISERISQRLIGTTEGYQGAARREKDGHEALMAYMTAEEAPWRSTGLESLDHQIGGLRKGNSVIIAGRSSMGKTALAVYIAYRAAERGEPVTLHSLEMSDEEVRMRMISIWLADRGTTLPYTVLMRKRAQVVEWEQVKAASEAIARLPIKVIEASGLGIDQIRADVIRHRQHFAAKGRELGLVVIDYLQLIRQADPRQNRVQALGQITKAIKTMAKQIDVPVITLSQLSRAVEQREDKRPRLSDLRDSGEIEEDADIVILAFREAYYLEREKHKDMGKEADRQADLAVAKATCEAIVDKNRHGETGTVKLGCDMATNRFWDQERV